MSLRLRLALGIGLVVAVSLAVLGFVVVGSTRSSLIDSTRRQLLGSLFNRTSATPPPPDGADRRTDTRGLATAHFAFELDGSLIVAEPAGPPSEPLPLPDLRLNDIVRLRSGHSVTVDAVDGSMRYLVLAANRANGRTEVEAAPLDQVDATIAALIGRFVLGALLMLAIAVGAVVAVLRHGLRPLDDVIVTADAVAQGEREQRIPTDRGPTEVRRLSSALDRMLQQQRAELTFRDASESRLRQFISDASHELQTPITSVLGWTQLQRKGALDAAGEAAAMERIEAESRRMAALVDDLLLLARIDEHRSFEPHSVASSVIDLAAIAHDAVLDARAVDPDRSIVLDAPQPVVVAGNPDRLRQVVDNLLRNVRVHTPAGTPARVVVRASPADGTATIVVEDEGVGIDPEHLVQIFDRFWRRDASRVRTTGGAGLGLAIVSALVEAHGGSVVAANREGGGAVFTVTLPLPFQ